MNYGWMLFSLVFGVFGHLFRGWRWNLTLAPLGEYPKLSDSVYAVFVSYAANLVIPRVGEISRCGILAKYDGVSFSKSLGTVVTERLIDTLCVVLITGVTLLLQSRVFSDFFAKTGTNIGFSPNCLLLPILHYPDLYPGSHCSACLSVAPPDFLYESAWYSAEYLDRVSVVEACQESAFVPLLYSGNLGLLFLPVLRDLFLF